MEYVLTNNNGYYCCLSETNAVKKTNNIQEATRFKSVIAANNLRIRASKKLRGFQIVEVETKQIVKPVKRRQFSTNERKTIYNKTEGKCAICGRFVPFDEFTVDHIIPLAKGGNNELKNLQCTCQTCNLIKQDILPEDLMDKITEIVSYQLETSDNDNLMKKMIETLKKNHTKFKLIRRILA